MAESVVGGAADEMQNDECRMHNEKKMAWGNLLSVFIRGSPSGHNTVMELAVLHKAIADLPPGRWAVGVSGGADSVALLLLLAERADLALHIVHLDHETRDGESSRDAQFVFDLAATLGLPCSIAKRSAIEKESAHLSKNLSDRYRRARFELFQQVVRHDGLQGVVLAHHADDQAETVAMRILRGAGPTNLTGIRTLAKRSGLTIARPLLEIPGQHLRDYLRQRGQIWCEDASNHSGDYLRNRLRAWLARHPTLREEMLRLESASHAARVWLESVAPSSEEVYLTESLGDLPLPVGREAAMRWLVAHGAPPSQVNRKTCERLIKMCVDAASPPRQHFPGGLLVRRARGRLVVEPLPN